MGKLTLEIVDKKGKIKNYRNGYEERDRELQRSAEKMTYLAGQNFAYEAGDIIRIRVERPNQYLMVQLDEALAPTLVYLKKNIWDYQVPVEEKIREAYSAKVFSGNRHYLSVREASEEEINQYQNLALNPHDQKESIDVYPHVFANVETRNDATFFARNAIDGVYANESHGSYPYQSWGINQQADAAMTLDFGRKVEIDKIGVVLRGDYPHDSWWKEATVVFSDGSQEVLSLKKLHEVQYFTITPRIVESLVFKELIRGDEALFPALTQIEAYGSVVDE